MGGYERVHWQARQQADCPGEAHRAFFSSGVGGAGSLPGRTCVMGQGVAARGRESCVTRATCPVWSHRSCSPRHPTLGPQTAQLPHFSALTPAREAA